FAGASLYSVSLICTVFPEPDGAAACCVVPPLPPQPASASARASRSRPAGASRFTFSPTVEPSRRIAERARVDDLEVGALDAVEAVQVVVRPPSVRRAGDVPARPVVGDDHPVALQRDEDDARLAGEARDVEAR